MVFIIFQYIQTDFNHIDIYKYTLNDMRNQFADLLDKFVSVYICR